MSVSWSDANWARDFSERRSRTVYLLTIEVSPVVWDSQLHSFIEK